jgi:hypothetical protein
MPVSYLPNISPKNNNTSQMRRRANDTVSQVDSIQTTLNPGTNVTGTVPIPSLTTGGKAGSITFQHGIITSMVNPT